ncbi:RabGAP/TBC [Hysterangium stoloniferum]|nr:RabGAP/TBC [Hysterangium stoloniferum]
MGDEETVQIKDMEFELVRPAMPQLSPELSHGDDSSDSRDAAQTKSELRMDTASSPDTRTGRQLLSPVNDHRIPSATMSSVSLDSVSKKSKSVDPSLSVQAHRDRELKWISTINSTDSAQARKSKKIKKLLVEGVPSSVRYLVWAHISDSASKKMANVYTQLSQRRPVMAEDIERDVQQSFPDNVQLRDPKGPLVSVLYAYIAMIPDLRYHRGLAIIAGHLLLQSPEEDAFWTFLAMMDSYLRPYFMPTSAQMSVDTNLFIKAVETSDSQLATRLFVELRIRPAELCGTWFSSVFAGTLPLPHLHRVWDLFIYEGVPFLFRVGLTILSLCRHYFLEGPMKPDTLPAAYLLYPPPEAFPADAEAFIAQTLAVKLKDDDIRKSRVKMEAAVKQQQQRAPRISTSQVPSHPHLQGGKIRVS